MSDTRDAVGRAIAGALAEADEMVTKWLTIIETIDTDGVRALWLLSNDDAKAWDNIGLLGYAIQCEQSRSTTNYLADDD